MSEISNNALTIVLAGAEKFRQVVDSELPDDNTQKRYWISDSQKLDRRLRDLTPDCILLQTESLHCTPQIVQMLRKRFPDALLLALAQSDPPEHLILLIKNGLDDFLDVRKGFNRLRSLVGELMELRKQEAPQRDRLQSAYTTDSFIGQSDAVQRVRQLLDKLIRKRDITVLLRGETGTGKELISRIIHTQCTTPGTPFVEVNCAAIPEHLLEAELFGYEPGAFTDAKIRKQGLFEVSENGTLFLDEIGHMSPALQVKLLKALEEREFRHLGGTQTLKFRARVIAATNRDLESAIKTGEFRADLYYRLSVMTITLPPLRDRGDDMLMLARHFADIFCREMEQPAVTFSAEVRRVLQSYPWPGNVRELRNAMERAVLLADDNILKPDDLFPPGVPKLAAAEAPPALRDLSRSLSEVEGDHILAVLQANEWNRTISARILGISRPRLLRKIKEYELK